MTSPKLLRIAVFYLIALVFAYFFRYAQPEWYDTLDLPAGLTIVRNLLSALGPWLGAFLVTILLRPERKVSLFGSGRLPSLIMIAVPVVVFTLFGASNSDGLNEYYYGLIVGLLMAVYCLFEESGWRGYLQDELRGMNPFLRYVVIGVMWYAWHLTLADYLSHTDWSQLGNWPGGGTHQIAHGRRLLSHDWQPGGSLEPSQELLHFQRADVDFGDLCRDLDRDTNDVGEAWQASHRCSLRLRRCARND